MAINANPSHENQFCFFVAKSGGGKSQMLRSVLPKGKARILGWDRAMDYEGLYFDDFKAYARAVTEAIKSGSDNFRLFYTGSGGDVIADHEQWASLVWAALDGDHLTYVVDEELAETAGSVNKARPNLGRLITQGRKFGLVHMGTTQRPQEIPKTITGNAQYIYVGQQKAANIKMYAELLELSRDDIVNLNSLEFFKYDDKEAVKVKCKYKAPKRKKCGKYVRVS